MKERRGQVGVTQIVLGSIGLFLIIVLGIALVDWSNNGRSDFGGALQNSLDSVSTNFMTVLGPLFNVLLNLGEDANTNFLVILTFILISIIIVGTLDSVNIFGDDNKGNLTNLAVGIIVSIIGVRFMPNNMWLSLTAPSSAFVATILVGAPFLALFFVTMKLKYPLARKLLWLFYIIFMSYLIFFPGEMGRDQISPGGWNDFIWIYIVFLVLAGIMLFFDSTVRRYIGREKHQHAVEKQLATKSIEERHELRNEIDKWQEIASDRKTPKDDRNEAKKQLRELKNLYGNLDLI